MAGTSRQSRLPRNSRDELMHHPCESESQNSRESTRMRVSGILLKPRSTCLSCTRKCCLRLAVGNLACPQRELDQFAARQITTKDAKVHEGNTCKKPS